MTKKKEMLQNDLTEQEKEIIKILRELIPYEKIEIIKDQLGRKDHYLVVRTQKIVISKTKVN